MHLSGIIGSTNCTKSAGYRIPISFEEKEKIFGEGPSFANEVHINCKFLKQAHAPRGFLLVLYISIGAGKQNNILWGTAIRKEENH
ncbi:unnamed protein product [Allacma fusca]|uniref:Uncharacterized protein n=1 Tax=Allacma fusca TaxID=39272 RepID=A0A8J2KD79_9HEXA|nr:unnamed protein product [Allacma fusca]